MDKNLLSFLKPELSEEILQHAQITEVPKGTEILRADQYIKTLPIVIKGLIKVYAQFEEKELLLYYIEPSQSCVMTFYAALKNAPSRVYASTEEDSEILLIPVHLLPKWVREYPDFNALFYDQYNLRYSEMLDTIGHLLMNKMDKRLYDHLSKKSALLNNAPVKMSHIQIANELGTAREVVTRVLKKLETEGKVKQSAAGIEIIAPW